MKNRVYRMQPIEDAEAMTNIVERLRDCGDDEDMEAANEIERLTKLNKELVKHDGDAEAVCDSYATENQQFHDEIERLRAALHETTVAIEHVQKHLIHGSPPQDAVMNGALVIARATLEAKS
jgi:hypothetical protein